MHTNGMSTVQYHSAINHAVFCYRKLSIMIIPLTNHLFIPFILKTQDWKYVMYKMIYFPVIRYID